MDADPLDNPVRYWAIYFAILGVILFVGWKEPLRYRFLSRAQIDAIEHPPTPVPAPKPPKNAPPPPSLVDPNWRNPLNRGR